MSKLQFNNNKTLKLVNVLKYKLLIDQEDFNFEATINQMQTYIKSKGAMQIGPLIQYTRTYVNEAGELDMELIMMLQCNNHIHNVEAPYSMEPIIRVPNAMYCRYNGPENTLKFAYDKINLEAFENDIELSNCSYTIFVNNNEEEETIMADVFIPRADNE